MRRLATIEAANKARGVEEIALEAGVTPKTIRGYIAVGLIPPQRKSKPATRYLEIQAIGRDEAIRQGYNLTEIARVFNVSRQRIHQVKSRLIDGVNGRGNPTGGMHGGSREGAGRPANDKYHRHTLEPDRRKQ